MKRYLAPILLGIAGLSVLLALGVWQIQRLAWKQAILADIEARIAADPVPLPDEIDPEDHAYLPVTASGATVLGARVLASVKLQGAGYRMIDVLDTGTRRVLLDRGFLPMEQHTDAAGPQEITVTGNLHWPRETDRFTPDPDLEDGLWFARDVPAMAAALDTEPVLIVAREVSGFDPPVTPLPVDTAGIPNNHLQYALTWFSLCLVWAGMTAFLLWRIRRKTV